VAGLLARARCSQPGGRGFYNRVGGGFIDGKSIKATKDYLKWDGALFERPKSRKKARKKTKSLAKKLPQF
jgi:hypothetical protein